MIYELAALHKKLNTIRHKALIRRCNGQASDNKCLLLCPCEKYTFLPIRAPPERILKFNVNFQIQSGGYYEEIKHEYNG